MLVIVFAEQMVQVNASRPCPPISPQAAEMWVRRIPTSVLPTSDSWKWICASSTHLETWGYKQIEETYIISEMLVTRNNQNMLFRWVQKFSSNTSCICAIWFFPPSFLFLFCLNPWTVKSFRNFQNILDQVVPKTEFKIALVKATSLSLLFSSPTKNAHFK